MLFAAEGGGFFSSSASGYTSGLSLLFLSHKNDHKKPSLSPWNHYHLVVEETDNNTHRASSKTWLSYVPCTSFICFGRETPDKNYNNPSSIRVSPPSAYRERKKKKKRDNNDSNATSVGYDCEEVTNRFALKSSLKKRSFSVDNGNDDVMDYIDRRKVRWPDDDTRGVEIAEVREFEPSEVDESDDEFNHGSGKTCMCTIM
ncbi:unnamed protein product [Cochlearia groenlandica]